MELLTQHINQLLSNHEYVIVQGLGGFVAQYIDASYDKEAKIFYPPYKTISFNPRLTMNDGLLVQSYMNSLNVDFKTATEKLNKDIEDLKATLHTQRSYKLTHIGTLLLTAEGAYKFNPTPNGIASPQLFGLYSYPITKQNEKQLSLISNNKATKNINKEKKTTYTLNINRELVNYMVAILSALFFYFAWAQPIVNSPNEQNEASILPFQQTILEHKKAVEQPKEIKIETQEEAHPTPTAEKASDDISSVPATQYSIVLASCITHNGAKKLIQNIAHKTNEKVFIHKPHNIRRVLLGLYLTRQEAQKKLDQLKENDKYYDAWIIKVSTKDIK